MVYNIKNILNFGILYKLTIKNLTKITKQEDGKEAGYDK